MTHALLGPARTEAPRRSSSGRPARVLIADDSDDMRLLLRLTLDLHPRTWVVTEAIDGLDAVRRAVADRPDAVVLDVAMPCMDGLDVIPRVRHAVPATKIVVLSGFDKLTMERAALDAGADAYLEKSAANRDLGTVLARLVPPLAV